MKVKLLSNTPIEIAYLSARTCYSRDSAIEMVIPDKNTQIKFIENILKTGHYSTVEGINFTFAIEDVSRSLLAQITRHRVGIQFSVQSQRYVKYDNPKYYEPTPILNNNEADIIYNNFLNECTNTYKKLLDLGIKAEDARYVLPNATMTNITTTINLRTLLHIVSLRSCNRASKEIRDLMKLIIKEIIDVEPWLKPYLVPQCEQNGGICKESKSCGRCPTLDNLLNKK